jgi:CRP-like cAMP-binding protein
MELGDGSIFGELAGLWSSRRGFQAQTIDECEMFTIGREALRRSITSGFANRRKNAKALIDKVKIFAELSTVVEVKLDLMSVTDSFEQKKYQAGDVIFASGTPMDTCFVFLKGDVQVDLIGCPADESTLYLSAKGDYAGEACLVRDGLQWSGTGKATTEVVGFAISRATFRVKFGAGIAARDGVNEAVPPTVTGGGLDEREGPVVVAAGMEVPAKLQGRKYAEFQRAARLSVELSGLDEEEVAAPDEPGPSASEFDGKQVKSTDFEWCCILGEMERFVGAAYWAGKEGWRGGVRVYLAVYKPSGTPYAVRVYDKAAIWSENGVNEARDEHQQIKELNHPRMLRLQTSFNDDRCMYYVMDLVLGTTINGLLNNKGVNKFKFMKEEWAQHYALQVAEALKYMHVRGLVHRNIHPEALLIDTDGWLRLGGTMFIRKPRPNARLWTVCGVPDYLAPELIQGLGHSRTADLWALGVLIHEMCTGRPPFDGDDPLDSMRLVLLNESKIILQDKVRCPPPPQQRGRLVPFAWFGS